MDSVIIIGMKHSGKSSLGKGLANNLSLPFFDTVVFSNVDFWCVRK